MYLFASLEMIIAFFLKYNIDITILGSYEQAILIVLCNILVLLFYFFVFYVVYKIIFKIIDWWFK